MTICLITVMVAVPLAPTLSIASDLEDMFERWESQHPLPLTGHLRYSTFHSGYIASDLTMADVDRLYTSSEVLRDSDGLRRFACALTGARLSPSAPSWPIFDFYFEGDRKKRDESALMTQVFDGETEIEKRRNNLSGGRSHITIGGSDVNVKNYFRGLADFCWIPARDDLSAFTVTKREGRRLVLGHSDAANGASIQLDVDPLTGDVLRRSVRRVSGEVQVLVQDDFRVYPGGIRFPNVVYRAEYQQDRLHLAGVSVIIEATFNRELPAHVDGLTDVDAASGDVIHDNRTSSPVEIVTPVAGKAKEILRAATGTSSIPRNETVGTRFLVGLAALVLFCIVVGIVFRRKK